MQEEPEMQNLRDSASYMFGIIMSNEFSNEELEQMNFNDTMVLQGIKDGMFGEDTLMSRTERRIMKQ